MTRLITTDDQAAAMPNVLVIVPTIAKEGPTPPLLSSLKAAGYAVVCAALERGTDSMDLLQTVFEGRPPDILLVDLSEAYGCLPLQHVRRLLRQVWGEDVPSPLSLALLASSHLSQSDWTPHVDDFLLSPYAPAELIARLALLRFRRRHVPADKLLRFADVIVDLDSKRALDSHHCPLPLTPREYDLLEFLVTHRGKFFGRDRLLDLVWGVHFDGGERTVDIHIRRLRAKLPPLTADCLQTRRGTGYGLEF